MTNNIWLVGKRPQLAVLILTILISGCVEPETKVTTNGTGKSTPDKMLATGAVTGLGPINLSGTTLAETSTQALLNTTGNRSVQDLRLGMTTEISGTITNGSGQGEATQVVAQSAVRGRVGAIDFNNRTFTVLGVVVGLDQNTLFENTSGILGVGNIGGTRGITNGDVVDVFGIDDPVASTSRNPSSSRVLATRVIHSGSTLDNRVELVGTVGVGVSTSSPQILLGGNIVNVSGATQLTIVNGGIASAPSTATVSALRVGSRVRVIGTVDPAIDAINATQFFTSIDSTKLDDEIIALDATVTSLASATRVRMSGSEVDLAATGIASSVTPGARLQLRGRKIGGVVQATNARLIGRTERIEYSVDGAIAELNGTTFVVRGERISAASTTYTGGTATNLANAKQVTVKGFAGRGQLDATSVTFK
jgi:Domain of unknown function (DUF5666)